MNTNPDIFARLETIRRVFLGSPGDVQFGGNKKTSSQFGTSLYAIEDCESAIRAYEKMPWPEDVGGKYLAIYGVLQAMVVQQDAVRHLHEAINKKFELDDELKSIRNCRNMCVGHPSKQDRPPNDRRLPDHHTIVQPTISRHGFDVLSLNEPDGFRDRNISVLKMIEVQRLALDTKLSALASQSE